MPRACETRDLAAYLAPERARLYDDASPRRREQLDAAERRAQVFSAYNAVASRTREGSHVTGLAWVPADNTLVIYMDSAAWAQEMSMMREIVRARMAAAGASVDAVVVRTNRMDSMVSRAAAGQAPRTAVRAAGKLAGAASTTPPHEDLSADEIAALDAAVAPIEDVVLREALERAMKASFSWEKGKSIHKGL